MESKQDKGWEKLRALVGAGPVRPIFPTKRQHVSHLSPGEKLLVIRKLGGLGDILVSAMIFPELFEQYPEIDVTYAIPKMYFPLFAENGRYDTKLKLMSYEDVYGPVGLHIGPESTYHRAGVRKEILEQFDLIEDISYPCRLWEQLMIQYGFKGLRWRNRLDRWARWIGVEIRNPQSVIRINRTEIKAARQDIAKTGKPVVIWSPISAGMNRSYPWYQEVRDELEKQGFEVWYLHTRSLGRNSLVNPPLRKMGAYVGAADVVLSMDTATFHWGGILGRPTVGIFNLLLGKSHGCYYPTARTLQFCDTPCIGDRYDYTFKNPCEKWFTGPAPLGPAGETLSKCFRPDSIAEIVGAVKDATA